MADKLRRRSDGPGRWTYPRMRRQFLANCAAKGATCWFCGNELDFSLPHGDPRAVTVHHIQAVVNPPHLEFDTGNWAPACARCNKLGEAAFGLARMTLPTRGGRPRIGTRCKPLRAFTLRA
jgi:hypothetical protein